MEVPQRLRASKNWIGGGGRQGFVLPFLEGERELGIGGVPVRENVANAIKCQICNGEKARSCGIVCGLEMARSATGTKSLF